MLVLEDLKKEQNITHEFNGRPCLAILFIHTCCVLGPVIGVEGTMMKKM